jgi:hypothetical protein
MEKASQFLWMEIVPFLKRSAIDKNLHSIGVEKVA